MARSSGGLRARSHPRPRGVAHARPYDGAVHRVVALALDGVVAFDLAVPAQVFGHRRAERPWAFVTCTLTPGPVQTSTPGVTLLVDRGLGALRRADTIVVPGHWHPDREWPAEVLGALRAADRRGARLVSICTGAFVLAAAGVLDGRRATTHWHETSLLAEQYPAVRVEPGVLFCDEGRVLTSAGVAAGLDLCLHLVRRDHGAEVANAVARRIVMAPHREGGQAQFVPRPVPAAGQVDAGLAPTLDWALGRLDRPLTVGDLARHAAMSERTLLRRFREQTATTPLRWLVAQRVDLARRLLERGDLDVEAVARRCGFGTAASLREHFRRATGTSPAAYRRAFAGDQRRAASMT